MKALNLSRTKLAATLIGITLINFLFKKSQLRSAETRKSKSALTSHNLYSQTDTTFTFLPNEAVDAENRFTQQGCKCDEFQRRSYNLENSFKDTRQSSLFIQNRKTLQKRLNKLEITGASSSSRALLIADGTTPLRYPVHGLHCEPFQATTVTGVRIIYRVFFNELLQRLFGLVRRLVVVVWWVVGVQPTRLLQREFNVLWDQSDSLWDHVHGPGVGVAGGFNLPTANPRRRRQIQSHLATATPGGWAQTAVSHGFAARPGFGAGVNPACRIGPTRHDGL